MAYTTNNSVRLDAPTEYANSEPFNRSRYESGFSLRKTTIHHERSRAIAEMLWTIEPELTIAEMARRREIVEIGCQGYEYDVRTVCRWLASLKDYRRPGRPRKKLETESMP